MGTPSPAIQPPSLLHPLDLLCRAAGRPVPWHEEVRPESIPQPFRALLVHNRDMTSTLEHHHGGPVHLRVLNLSREGDTLHREVLLCRDRDGVPVEFGATLARLGQFEEPWLGEILASKRPLGGILNASRKPYASRPSAYLRVRADAFLRSGLGLTGEPWLYGRRNMLTTMNGDEIASILEILPPY